MCAELDGPNRPLKPETEYVDAMHVVMALGQWLDTRKNEVRGNLCGAAVQPAAADKPKPASPEEWLDALGRWRAEQDGPSRPPTPTVEYADAVHGVVPLGRWVDRRKRAAQGKRASAAVMAAAKAMMPRVQAVLGLEDADWWVARQTGGDGKPKPASPEAWPEALGRWRTEQERPSRPPAAKAEHDDAVHGVVPPGRWVDSRKRGSEAA